MCANSIDGLSYNGSQRIKSPPQPCIAAKHQTETSRCCLFVVVLRLLVVVWSRFSYFASFCSWVCNFFVGQSLCGHFSFPCTCLVFEFYLFCVSVVSMQNFVAALFLCCHFMSLSFASLCSHLLVDLLSNNNNNNNKQSH